MYGTQTESELNKVHGRFENDVKMYGTQTQVVATTTVTGLRMM